MNKRDRGRCIIFNNHKFSRMRERTGTNVDAELLGKLFKRLSFSVEEVKDSKSAVSHVFWLLMTINHKLTNSSLHDNETVANALNC